MLKSTLFKVWIGFMGGIVFSVNCISLYGMNHNYQPALWKMVGAVVIPIIFSLAYQED